jgi:hypothetical protein
MCSYRNTLRSGRNSSSSSSVSKSSARSSSTEAIGWTPLRSACSSRQRCTSHVQAPQNLPHLWLPHLHRTSCQWDAPSPIFQAGHAGSIPVASSFGSRPGQSGLCHPRPELWKAPPAGLMPQAPQTLSIRWEQAKPVPGRYGGVVVTRMVAGPPERSRPPGSWLARRWEPLGCGFGPVP